MASALIAGLLAGLTSIPHCALMCGPLAMACNAQRNAFADLRYQLGRLLSYGFFGFIAGSLGQRAVSWIRNADVKLVAGGIAFTLLVFFALKYLGRNANTTNTELLPLGRRNKATSHRFGKIWLTLQRKVAFEPLLVGLLSVFIPCGVLLIALGLAAATQNASHGAVLMSGFVVSSSPGLFLPALLGKWLGQSKRTWVNGLVPVIYLLSSILVLWSAYQIKANCH